MENEIREIIAKNLPAQMGEVLRKRLEQAKEDAETVKEQKDKILSLEATERGLRKELDTYRQFDIRNAGMDVRERELDQRERELKIAELSYQLINEKEKTTFAKEVALGLVRNTTFREDVFNNKSIPVQRDGYVQYDTESGNTIKTKTAE